MNNQKYFAGLLDHLIATPSALAAVPIVSKGGLVEDIAAELAGDLAAEQSPAFPKYAATVLTVLRDSPVMTDTWDWLRELLRHRIQLPLGWEGFNATPELRFVVFIAWVLQLSLLGLVQTKFRGEGRAEALDRVAKARKALRRLETALKNQGLYTDVSDPLRQIEEVLVTEEATIRGFHARAPHVKFAADLTTYFKVWFGSPYTEHVTNITSVIFDIKNASVDTTRKAVRRGKAAHTS
jgi:hypothetical protein